MLHLYTHIDLNIMFAYPRWHITTLDLYFIFLKRIDSVKNMGNAIFYMKYFYITSLISITKEKQRYLSKKISTLSKQELAFGPSSEISMVLNKSENVDLLFYYNLLLYISTQLILGPILDRKLLHS